MITFPPLVIYMGVGGLGGAVGRGDGPYQFGYLSKKEAKT